jgi:squalene synthase HpnC
MIRAALHTRRSEPLTEVAQAPVDLAPPPGPWSLDRAYAHCERIVRDHYENFPVASRFVPAALRPHMWALYAFARSADDFADEPRYAGHRAEALDYWEAELGRCFHGEADHPVFVALKATAEARDLPITPLEELLASFRMDLATRRYATYRDLGEFTRLSAEPVGRLVLYIFGHRDPALHRYSDAICTALQQANLWQDTGIDAARDRIYLPAEDLHHFGVREQDLLARRASPALKHLMRFQVARTRSLFERGRPLCDLLPGGLGMEIKLIWLAGMKVLDRIEQGGFDVLQRRPELGLSDKAGMLLELLAWRARGA